MKNFVGRWLSRDPKPIKALTRRGVATSGIVVSALLATVSFVQAKPIVQGPDLTWHLSLWGEPRPFTKGAERLSALLSASTGGRWKLELHYRSTLAKPYRNFDGLKEKKFQAAAFCTFFHPSKTPALGALSLPFLPLGTWDNNRKVRDAAYADQAVRKEAESHGVHLYTSTYLPPYELIGVGKPPREPDDWDGRVIRAGGGIGRAAKVLGGIVGSSIPSEMYNDFQTGALHMAALPFSYAHVGYKLHEVAQWFTTNLAPGSADCPLAFSLHAYTSLPDAYKALLEQVRADVAAAQIAAYQAIDATNLPILKAKLQAISVTSAERNALFEAAGKPVIEDWIKHHEKQFAARELI
ncbi:MAG: hypothetical protein KDJ36_17380, partial [Hyphomicrobiaceae bacterium]|nr:hypothetical protein [Hyphomicrobiaceae bacterium]